MQNSSSDMVWIDVDYSDGNYDFRVIEDNHPRIQKPKGPQNPVIQIPKEQLNYWLTVVIPPWQKMQSELRDLDESIYAQNKES